MKKDIFTKDSRIKEVIEKLSGIPCAKSMLKVLVYKTYLETCIYPISVIKMSLLVLGSYAGSLFLLRGKAGKVDLVESLKDNRE